MKRNNEIHSWHDFTLLELLIVIAVIAILASLLLPALRQAKEKSKSIQCTAQLKQLGLSTQMYLGDAQGYFPPMNWNITSNAKVWGYTLAEGDYIPPITQASSFLQCPSEPQRRSDTTYRFGVYGYNYIYLGSNYCWKYGGSWGSYLPTAQLAKIRKPSATVMFLDSDYKHTEPGVGFYMVDSWEATYYPGTRHNGGTNILWVDGHVSYNRPQNTEHPYTGVLSGGATANSGNPDNNWDRD